MNYLEFWQKEGLNYIIPPETKNPEGFDVGEVLKAICPGYVLEIGCGTGRIAKHFSPDCYLGIDINPAAVAAAKAALPNHVFIPYPHDKKIPPFETVLFYTVCLHIPDDMIEDQLRRVAASDRIVIAEIMNPKYRENRNPADEYHVSNQRHIDEYREIMGRMGFVMVELMQRPYAFYHGEVITFAVFER